MKYSDWEKMTLFERNSYMLNIREKNIVIGTFMGHEIKQIHGQGETVFVYKIFKLNEEKKNNWYTNHEYDLIDSFEKLKEVSDEKWVNIDDHDGLKYESSWTMLMNVIEKIKLITINDFESIELNDLKIKKDTLLHSHIEHDITEIWEKTYEFCNWAINNKFKIKLRY